MAIVWPLRAVVQVATKSVADRLTVMGTSSVSERVPSETVSRNVRVVGMSGAVNVGDDMVESESVTAVPDAWLHEYDKVSLSGSLEPVPFSVTVSPVSTVWSAPASDMGARLTGGKTITGMVR